MRSAIVAGAFVAISNAAPLLEERAYTVTEVTDVYTTIYEDSPADSAPTTATKKQWWWKGKHNTDAAAAATSVVVVTATPAAPAPAYSAPAAPAPEAPSAVYTPEAAPVASSAPAAPAPTTASVSAPGDYAQTVVNHHNAHRANHSAPALQWDAALAATALKIANSCNYAHDVTTDGGGYGQNIAAGCPANNISSVITDLFYNNEAENFNSLYGQATPSNINDVTAFDGYGHFTQIVWKGTSAVGCATVDCTGKGNGPKGLGSVDASVPPIFTVCNYKSAGNFLGEFDKNVLKPLGQPMITWSG